MRNAVDGETAANAAWYYPEPKEKAAQIKDHVAFYGSVTIEGAKKGLFRR